MNPDKEYEDAMQQKKLWCPHCRHRTLHEYDPGGDVNKWQPQNMPAGWWCMDCGETNEA